MAAPTKSLTTESGTITAWLPVLTPYPSIAACSSQVFRNDGGIIAFDPYFPGHMGDTGVHCLPQELSLSWWQRDAGTTTILGPTFVCPEAWSVVKTIEYPTAVQSLCCPSNYRFATSVTGYSFASQCTSNLTPGETMFYNSYFATSNTWQRTSTIVASANRTFVYGFHMNGFNVLSTFSPSSTTSFSTPQSLTTSQSITNTPPPALIPTPSAPSQSNTREDLTPSTSLSAGTIAGVVIGIFAVLSIFPTLYLLTLRRRRARPKTALVSYTHHSSPSVSPNPPTSIVQNLVEVDGGTRKGVRYELPLTQPPTLHEMSAEHVYR